MYLPSGPQQPPNGFNVRSKISRVQVLNDLVRQDSIVLGVFGAPDGNGVIHDGFKFFFLMAQNSCSPLCGYIRPCTFVAKAGQVSQHPGLPGADFENRHGRRTDGGRPHRVSGRIRHVCIGICEIVQPGQLLVKLCVTLRICFHSFLDGTVEQIFPETPFQIPMVHHHFVANGRTLRHSIILFVASD